MDYLGIVVGAVLIVLYAWTFYNFPTLLVGLRRILARHKALTPTPTYDPSSFPRFSLVVAAKNEEPVIARLLNRLKEIDYPSRLYEVIVVEDGSTDRTREICESFAAENPALVGFYHRESSTGKPAALNFALEKCGGDVIGVIDADNFPSVDMLRRAAVYFEDPTTAAIQGMTLPINADENMITKLGAFEEAAWFKVYMMGKEELKLFVPLTGSCGFLRRQVVSELGGWDDNSLAEDVELAARLIKNGRRTRYAPDVQSMQEYPASLRELVKQRTRWFRGYMETWVRYGSLLRTFSRISLDAEATLFGPYVLNLVLFSYAVAVFGLVDLNVISSNWFGLLAASATIITLATLFVCGVALAWHLRPFRLRNLMWIPAVYMFWFMQTFVAFRALLLTIFRIRRSWVKTNKTGYSSRPEASITRA